MKVLKINGKEKIENSGFRAEVVFPSENRYDVTVGDPFMEPGEIETDSEERLRWYFEKHLWSPYTDKEQAARAADSITGYGETLFARLFADARALAEWRELANGLDTLRVQVYSEDREFQALHWEALKDPEESTACCLRGVEFVRTSGVSTPRLPVEPGPYLNVLMVTARPGGKDDVDYRTVTRPVVETVEKNRMPVRIHLLRPPTFAGLREHLRERRGFYHIIHFDVHGDVLTYEQYKAVTGEGKPAHGAGRRGTAAYEGTRPFILLVGENGGADLVAADDAAELLRGAHVPVCFLNACRSGTATLGVSGSHMKKFSLDASLAMRFLERGVRLVLGMAWSLMVTAARIMMTRLYDALTRGEAPGTALNLARRALADDGCRFRATDCTVVLEDWLLPVVWGKGDFSLELLKPYPEDTLALLERQKVWEKELEGVTREGKHGFLGRDVDILAVESALWERNILLVKGMGGTGKTTLLGHLAEWWWKTGWLDHVFYFGYDLKPYRGEEILNVIAEAVMPKAEFGTFLVLPDVETKALSLAAFLKEGKETLRVLLILDNMESITGTEQAVGSRLEKEEQKRLTEVLKRLMRSTMKILLGSRADEEWLGEFTFKDRVYVLEGLDHESRFDLAKLILGDMPVENSKEFKRLMDILAGYPLAMEIILPNLSSRGAGEMVAMLTGAGVDLQDGGVSEEIIKCINISFSLLTEKAQKSVPVFAPFTSFLNANFLEEYLKEIRVSGSFSHLTLEDLEEALLQGEKQGLLKQVAPRRYSIQPVFPFFLGEQAAHLFDAPARAALEQGFCNYMSVVAAAYKKLMESKEPEERKMGFFLFKQDRENLYKALHRVLDNEGDFYNLFIVFNEFYLRHPLYNEAIEFMEGVVKKLELYSKKDRKFLANYGYVVGNLGTNYMGIKEFSKSKDNHKKALTLLQQADKRQETGIAYHQLGHVAFEERDWEEAKRNYLEALKIFQKYNNRCIQGKTYHQLGYVAYEERDWEEAKQKYRKALKIFREFNDWYNQANTYHQLGMVAEEERDWEEAKRYYGEALKTFREFGDRHSQASTYGQLGFVAFEERDWEEVKRNCREALKIFQEFDDRYNQAKTYYNLGNVAEEETDYASSLGYYVTALEIYDEYNDKYEMEKTIHNLSLLLAVDQWDAAKAIEALEKGEETKQALRALLEKIKSS